MADPRWTTETRSAVAAAVAGPGCTHLGADSCEPWWIADRMLAALADAGLLLPPGGKTHEEWAVRVDEPHPRRGEKAGDYLALPGGELIARHGPKIWAGWVPVRRTVHIGPWTEVSE